MSVDFRTRILKFFKGAKNMLNFASTFVNSLRNSDVLSPTPKKRTIQHTGCKGSAHGHGSYNSLETSTERASFERTPSIRRNGCLVEVANAEPKKTVLNRSERVSESDSLESGQKTPKPSPFQRTSSVRSSKGKLAKKPPVPALKPKTASISSENFSESDSIDSSDNKTKSSEENSKKHNDVCSRLYSSGTKASEAKTAKMRHLDIFDVDEASWMGGLRKVADESHINSLKKKITNLTSEADNPFARSRNGSIRRSGKVENLSKSDQTSQSPKVPPRSFLRKSFRRNKVKCADYSDIALMSADRKTMGFFYLGDKVNCLKKLEEFYKKPETIEVSSIAYGLPLN